MQMKDSDRQPLSLDGDPLAEIRRRLIQIHVALASATDDDREIRRTTLRRVMDLLNDIAPRDPGAERESERARRVPGRDG
jgi:hypothetical protein